jgi:hypothetical protein
MVEDIVFSTKAFMAESILLPHGRGLYVSLYVFADNKVGSPRFQAFMRRAHPR